MRRFIALLGILALALTIVPSGIATTVLDCCSGTMCPMHPAQKHEPNCSMDQNHPAAAVQPCPVQSEAHYTAAVVFVLVEPVILHDDAPSHPAAAFLLNFSSDAELRVEAPPPRSLQTA
jgi:hypothetical protein